MKKRPLLLLMLFFCALFSHAQNPLISINNPNDIESRFSPSELVEGVLVRGGCSGVSNFSSQVHGAPGNLNTKSYGFFNKPVGVNNFPFERGIILSTGAASGGGNMAIPDPPGSAYPSVDNPLGGDSDLEAALGRDETQDATFIKFDFIPRSNTISFRFIMASEEYDGATECAFADGFAFLLREVGTAAYTNLAVLPDGTPVSVRNINNAQACSSNTNFFEGYDLGDTNYGGRTKILTASAVVFPGRSYEIKLVVADEQDGSWDSAIFIEAGSFNLGVDLGEDRKITTGNAVCDDSLILETNADLAMHTWFMNGVEIPGAGNGETLEVTQPGTYSVEVDFGGACSTKQEVVIEFYEPVNVQAVQNLNSCSADSDFATFDLTENDDDALGAENPNDFIITYHLTQLDANNNTNAIDTTTAFLGENKRVVYIRLESVLSGCFDTSVFSLFVNNIGFNILGRYTICVNKDGTELVPPPILDTKLNTTDYSFEWYLDGELLVGVNNSSLIPTKGGTYNVVVTVLDSGCITDINDPNTIASVSESARPVLTANQVNLVFKEKNTVLVSAVSAGALINSSAVYEFSIDNGPWLSNSPNDNTYTFENLGPGEHTIVARDVNGCGTSSVTLIVIDYPTNFTPNGDGIKDTWNIVGIENQPEAKIYIFNRQGKLLKEMSPSGLGWDGTSNNNLLPTDDYWFKVEYTEPGDNTRKEFMTHFTLKR